MHFAGPSRFCILTKKKKNKVWIGNGRAGKGSYFALLLGALAVVVLSFFALQLQNEPSKQAAEKDVRILRVMTDNPNTCMAVGGEYRDWVELVNLSEEAVNIAGWKLSADADIRGAFSLPERLLESGESLVLYAGEPIEGVDPALFMGFSLNAEGEWLFLTDDAETLLDSVEIPALEAGYVYALDVESGRYSRRSPYAALGAGMNLQDDLTPEYAGGLVINELMASNGSSLRNGNGEYFDWIELYNGTASEIDLTGYTLSDDEMNRRRFVFPQISISSGEYLLLYASEADGAEGEIHLPFKLSSSGERVVLFDPVGNALSYMEYDSLEKNQSLARGTDGSVEKTYAASPGNANTAEGAELSMDTGYTTMEENALKLYINEVMCASKGNSDWVELVNESASNIDLSGFGLSDNPNKPRKWRFPEGTVIDAGEYLTVKLMGAEYVQEPKTGECCADFALDVDAEQTLLLSDADGRVIDRILLTAQKQDISYGRCAETGSYRYFPSATPNGANTGKSYGYSAENVRFSHSAGVQSGPIYLEMTSNEGMSIYYTLDGSEPTIRSKVYSEPVYLDSNTVVRACAYCKDGIPSDIMAQTYLFGVKHTLGIVAVSGNRSELIGSSGALRDGLGDKSYDVQAEIYDKQGNLLINQKCALKLNGRSSRTMFDQKAFRLVAKEEYGDNRFRAELFSKRDYEEYKSVVLRAAGQDNRRAFMRDVVITSLARNTSLMYQESEPVVVYINGNYWGVYHLRERISPHSIAQFEGWENEDAIDFLEGAYATEVQGSNDSFIEAMNFVRRYGVKSDANLEKLKQIVDVENYLDYVILQMYCNNQDLNNIRVYRSSEGDGKWRWILYDTDLGFLATRNSVKAWCSTSGGGKVGSITEQSNLLFTQLLKNAQMKDCFLRRFGELLATDLSAESVTARIEEVYNAIAPEMQLHCKRWNWSIGEWQSEGAALLSYVKNRPATLVSQLIDEFNLSNEQAEHYFGEAKAAAAGK